MISPMATGTGTRRAEPFPFDDLRTFSAADARDLDRLARVALHVRAASGAVAGRLSQLLGCPVKLSVLAPSAAFRVEPSGSAGGPCAAASLVVAGGGGRILVLIPATLLHRILRHLLSVSSREATPDRSVIEALASLVVLEALASLPESAGPVTLRALALADDARLGGAADGMAVLDVKAGLCGGSDVFSILLGPVDLEAVAGRLGPAPGAGGHLRLRLPVAVVCAAARATVAQLSALSPGDVLFPDVVMEGATPEGPAAVMLALRKGGRYDVLGIAAAQGRAMRIDRTFLAHGERMMTDDDKAGGETTKTHEETAALPGAVADVPVEIAVEAARIEMSVGQIASLSPGSIISLDRPLNAEVTLTSGGRIVAYGVLVSVEGEMGVQILKVNA